jgi:hypothetical protein
MIRGFFIAVIVIVSVMTLLGLGAAFFGYPGFTGAAMGVTQLLLYVLLIAGIIITVYRVITKWKARNQVEEGEETNAVPKY